MVGQGRIPLRVRVKLERLNDIIFGICAQNNLLDPIMKVKDDLHLEI